MNLDDYFYKCSKAPGLSINKSPNSIEFCLNQGHDRGSLLVFPLFPGISLAYIFINSPIWPLPNLTDDTSIQKSPIFINYCITGRCEMLLDDNNFIYLKDGDFSIAEQLVQKQFIYPTRIYEGLEFFIDTDLVKEQGNYLEEVFHINIQEIATLYCEAQKTYISSNSPELKVIFQKLWVLYDEPVESALFKMQLYTLELLKYLNTQNTPAPSKTCSFFTTSQVDIAKKVEEIITSDLRQHYPIRELAQSFSISETSLKNYFRGVYGQNISVYLRELRMNTAAKLLEETKLSTSEISARVGYMNQSKFAAVFKSYFYITPLEYRRQKALSRLTT